MSKSTLLWVVGVVVYFAGCILTAYKGPGVLGLTLWVSGAIIIVVSMFDLGQVDDI